eukprot:jgi/Psemu1/62341/gm1.62341_g
MCHTFRQFRKLHQYVHYIVNQFREKNELPSLTYSAVRGCMNRLKPQILVIKKGKQGSKNIEHAWCRASFRWVAQLLLRFGKVKFSHPMFSKLLGDAYDVENPPACYDETLLTPLSLSKICWFDEMHKKAHIGVSGSRIGPGKPDVTMSFKRNLEGKLDPNGTYSKQKTVGFRCVYGCKWGWT